MCDVIPFLCSGEKKMMRRPWTLSLILAAPCFVFAFYIGRPWRWFSWHPLLMSLAFVAAAGSGIMVKRRGGRVNTITHGYFMIGAFVLAMGGWYVIYEQKKMLGKPHNTSWHSWQGVVACIGYGLGGAVGLAALHPDFGAWRTSKRIRLLHKLASRASTAAALAAIATGYSKLGDTFTAVLVLVMLMGLAKAISLFENPAGTQQQQQAAASLLPTSV